MKFNVEISLYCVSDDSYYEATWTMWTLNIAVGLQVLFGALTTGLSSALSAKQVSLIVDSREVTMD